ncbi:hypothetical protein [Falsiphaeobacter marinintestinus]|uniref:hypothetical protein n=1 Tax=Falsiphaeobacter marinintestinus TaxID=1492905 RepID=UPI0011B65A45|nr:hypothetical protein [Phaeobacter marinintestinus]
MTPAEIFPTLPPNPTDAEQRDYAAKLVQMILDADVPALRLQGFTDPDLFELRRLAHSVSTKITPLDLDSLRLFADKLKPV